MIKKIYTNGCSWSAGDGVQEDPMFAHITGQNVFTAINPLNHAWPACLGTIMDLPVFNDAWGGGSNERILRRLVEFTRELSEEERSETLIVIGWTSPDRGEIYLGEEKNYIVPDGWFRCNSAQKFSTYQQGVSKGTTEIVDRFQAHYVADIYDEEAAIQKHINQMILAKNLLENLKIPHLIFAGMFQFGYYTDDENVWKALQGPGVIDLRTQSMRQFLHDNNYPLGPSIHPLVDGHKAWAEHLYKELQTRKII